MLVRELLVRWGFQVDDAKLVELNKRIGDTSRKLNAMGKVAANVGANLSLKLTLPIVALGGAMIKAASDAEETEAKFGTVFKSISGDAEAAATNLADNFGLAQVKAKQLLGDTGDLLTGFGFAQDKALELSKGVNELAVDLASFTNFEGGAEGASQALTKALLGERESIKSLGISILEEDVKRQVALNTAKGMTFETNRQAKAFATLQLAQQQSKNAIGDFARTNQGFANQMRILKARALDLAVMFGKILLPPALKLVQATLRLVKRFRDLSPATKKIILITLGLAAALGPLLFVFGKFYSSIGLVMGLLSKLPLLLTAVGRAGLLMQIKLVAIPLAIVAAFALLFLLFEDIVGYLQGKDSVIGKILAGIPEIGRAFDLIFGPVLQPIANIIEMISGGFGSWVDILKEVGKVIVNVILLPIRAVLGLLGGLGGFLGRVTGNKFLQKLGNANKGAESFAVGFTPTTAPARSAPLGSGPASSSTTNNQTRVDAPITVNVPPGTPPEKVSAATRAGVNDAMSQILRETDRQATGPVGA